MKIYFQLKIPKYLEATYTINQEHIVKTMGKLKKKKYFPWPLGILLHIL